MGSLVFDTKEIHQGVRKMPTAVRISDDLPAEERKYSKADHRSLTGQREHWVRGGRCAEENSDLTYDLIPDKRKNYWDR
jgi:hypothetical protein